MKASDITDEAFLTAMDTCAKRRGFPATWWDMTAELKVFPEKVVLAKARRLLKRGIIDGCGCGCRGNWVRL